MRQLRADVARLRKRLGLVRPWISAEDNPAHPRPLASFRLFAITGTWMEADVIGATVRNAFTQGCERIYLLDNDSPDDTVAEALSAGAVLGGSFASEGYDELRRIALMQGITDRVSAAESDDHIWWLWLDADEFHHGPNAMTVKAYLESLDRRFRIVGASYWDHFPAGKPEYVPGFHPIEFQPLCIPKPPHTLCPLGCHSHPLRRFDRRGPMIRAVEGGLHRVTCDKRPLLEPRPQIFVHHFPYRDEAASRARLHKLCAEERPGVRRNQQNDQRLGRESGITYRFRTLDALYQQQWHLPELELEGQVPRSWREAAPVEHAAFDVWYTREELERAIRTTQTRSTS